MRRTVPVKSAGEAWEEGEMRVEVVIMSGGPGLKVTAENMAEVYILDLMGRKGVYLASYGGNAKEGRQDMVIGVKDDSGI